MTKILITGGGGFIGSHLAKKLIAAGHTIIIADRCDENSSQIKKDRLNIFLDPATYRFYNINITDTAGLTKVFLNNKFDVICHLAAKTNLESDSMLYNKTNILGTITIFEMAKKFKIPKVIFASTSMVYGGNTKLPFNENNNTDHPLSVYAAGKKSDEVLAYTYHHLYGIKMIGLRFFTTYGPWSRQEMSVNKFTEQILNKQFINLRNFGKIKKDFNYIDDTVHGLMAAIESDFDYELINIGSGQSVSLNNIVSLIEKALGKKAKIKYTPIIDGDLPKTCADIGKARNLLAYEPSVSLKKGIENFVQWYQKYYQS